LGDNAYFLGWQKINANLMKQIDILTLSSYSETFPAVIIEAFSSGIPVVATDVGSVRELLGSPLCGILVPPRDPAALADALIRLINNHQLTNKLSIMGLKRAELFSSDRFCEEMLQLTCNLHDNKKKKKTP
jgi:glycosyltransferase involved in cell wall biosynthesis